MNAGENAAMPGEIVVMGNGVMTRVRMVNTSLSGLGIDCGSIETLTRAGTVQLVTAQEMLLAGNNPGTRSAIARFRATVVSLRDAYREVLVREDLPGETARGVLSVAQSLDVTAARAILS